MSPLALSIFLVISVCCWSVSSFTANRPPLDGRIIGGTNASIIEFPYQLSLQQYGQHECGASIIGKEWALTAAHCTAFTKAEKLTVRAGTDILGSGGKVYQVISITPHEGFSMSTLDNDISLLKIRGQFLFSDKIKPIALPSQDENVAPESSAVVSGWGHTREGGEVSNCLQKVEVPIVPQDECNEEYDGDITECMICAGLKEGGRDACQGDSGGPLVANNKLIGIVSWGYGCARPNEPGVYTRVSFFRDWIKQNSGI